ncbi:MAG: hypothetical protein HY762_01790 [Planctomycetes bacterium]|nr:hypothetical protein [Planctomycetota bacterium]
MPFLNDRYKIVRDAAASTLASLGVAEKDLKSTSIPQLHDNKHIMSLDIFGFMMSDGKFTELIYQYIYSASYEAKIGVAEYQSAADDVHGNFWQILPGAKWYWGQNAPGGGYVYGEAGYTGGSVLIKHLNTTDRFTQFIYGFGIGYGWESQNAVIDISFGMLGSNKKIGWISAEGNDVLENDKVKPTLSFTIGHSF